VLATLLAIPVLGLVLLVQTVIFSRLPLVHGTADIVLVTLVAWALHERVKTAWEWAFIGGIMVSMISAMPFFVPVAAYLAVAGLGRFLQRRVWGLPVLMVLLVTFVGTLVEHLLSIVALRFSGVVLPVGRSLSLVTLPSVLLNLLLALPIYGLVSDLAEWVYPPEIDT